jgi:hypothetical protein
LRRDNAGSSTKSEQVNLFRLTLGLVAISAWFFLLGKKVPILGAASPCLFLIEKNVQPYKRTIQRLPTLAEIKHMVDKLLPRVL